MATIELVGKPPVKYVNLNAEKMHQIMKSHVAEGTIVEDYALSVGSEATSFVTNGDKQEDASLHLSPPFVCRDELYGQ